MSLSYEKYKESVHYSIMSRWYYNKDIMHFMGMDMMNENELRTWLNDPTRISLIFKNEDGNFVGTLNFYHYKTKEPDYEIGYLVDLNYRGKGYGSEMIRIAIGYAKVELKAKILREIYVEDFNISSRKVLEKNGFNLDRHDENKKRNYYSLHLN